MDAATLQDRISRGLGAAARAIGFIYDAYRPGSEALPISPENRFLRLHAAFNPRDPTFGEASAFGWPAWFGVFDDAYTRPGDYLVGPGGTFFIAAQEHLQAPLCVLTNATVSIARAAGAVTAGVQAYGGARVPEARTPVISGWPASLLSARGGGRGLLPGDGRPGTWVVLLPRGPFAVRTSDILMDEAGGVFVVDMAERSGLGMRITATRAIV